MLAVVFFKTVSGFSQLLCLQGLDSLLISQQLRKFYWIE